VDQNSFPLVTRSIANRIDAIRRAKPAPADGRGRNVVVLIEEMLTAVEAERDRIEHRLGEASASEAEALGRRLLRLLAQVTSFSTLTPYLADVGRRDLSLGLIQTADVLVQALLPSGADTVIHLDEHHMYSTLDLLALTKPTLSALGNDTTMETVPLVLFVPGIDPHSALLLPILAHEVGHSAVEQAGLGSTTLSTANLDPLNVLFDECLRAAGDPDPGPWQVQLFGWIDELLCDALALALTGPSFLFAESAFLPAPQLGTVGSHPFPSDRIRFALNALRTLGWEQVLRDRVPHLLTWLNSVAEVGRPPVDPRERFLREGLRTLEDTILSTARKHVSDPMTPDVFDNFDSRVMELMNLAVPPSQVGIEPVPPWMIVLAGWLHQFAQQGDEAETLAVATGDKVFNEYILKAIEMSRVAALWNTT
jgi:hypothetical protein